MGYGGGSGSGGSGGSGGGSGSSGGSGYRRVGDDRTANLKVNNITNRDGKTGTVVAGIPQVSSTSHFIVPSGDTRFRTVIPSQENIVTEGLIGLYDAGNPESFSGTARQWRDISGNDLHLTTFTGAASWAPTYGGAVISNGELHFRSDYFAEGYSWGTQGNYSQLTVEMWYKSPSTTDRFHLWNFGGSSSAGNLNMNLNDGNATWVYYEGNGTPYHIYGGTDGAYADNTVRHIVYTYDLNAFNRNDPAVLGDAHVYMNNVDIGKLANSGTQQFVNVNGQTPGQGYFSIFSGPSGTAYKMKIQSEIYKVAVYTKALTAAEVSQNYNALKYRFGL